MVRRFFVAVAALTVTNTCLAADLVMPGLTTQWIAQDMRLNGLPASMRTVQGDRPLAEVLNYYRRLWSGAIDERRNGEWHVLATRQRNEFISLRLQASAGGVRGVLTVSADPATVAASLDSPLPVPSGITRVSHQAFRDKGSEGENLTLISRRSVAWERQAFVSLYLGEGWAHTEDRVAQSVPDGHVLQFLRGKEQVRVLLYRDPDLADAQTLILVTAHRD